MKKHPLLRKTAVVLALTAACILIMICTAGAESATVYGGWLKLRTNPSLNAGTLASYPTGTVVTVNGQNGSWYSVTAPDGMNGWMLGTYLRFQGSGGGSSGGSGNAKITSQNGLNVRLRTGPGTGYTVLGSYPPGTSVTILSSGKDWSKVQIGNFTGYMMSKYLTGGGGSGSDFKPTTLPVPSGYTVWVTSKNGQGVNFREGPSQHYVSIGFYGVGTEATMLSLGNTWSYIKIGDRNGYMMTKFLTTTKPEGGGGGEIIPQGEAIVVSMNGKDVNLRTAASLNSQVIRTYPVGTSLTIITRGDQWYFIHIGDDYGYMMKKFIRE